MKKLTIKLILLIWGLYKVEGGVLVAPFFFPNKLWEWANSD